MFSKWSGPLWGILSIQMIWWDISSVLIIFYPFQSSRLHFIGTWRNRYRKRFPLLSNGLRYERSNLNAAEVNMKNVVIHIDMVSLCSVAIETHLCLCFLAFFSIDLVGSCLFMWDDIAIFILSGFSSCSGIVISFSPNFSILTNDYL